MPLFPSNGPSFGRRIGRVFGFDAGRLSVRHDDQPAGLMPGRCSAVLTALLCSAAVFAQPAPTPDAAASAGSGTEKSPVQNSLLDAPLFLDLLVGEIELREGEPGTAYAMLLDAARRTRDEQLYRRAIEIALEARAGEQALSAARAWRDAQPKSIEAHRYVVQILIALNKPRDAVEPLQSLIRLTPDIERPALISSLPRFFARGTEKRQSGSVLEQVLKPFVDTAALRTPSLVAIGRGWQASEENDKALQYAQRAQAADPQSEGASLLALELLPTVPAAEAIVQEHLKLRPNDNGVRLVYARQLAAAQRYPDAITQLEAITRDQPTIAQPWLSLGALNLELRQTAAAEAALQRYVDLVQNPPAPDPKASATGLAPDEDDDPNARKDALTQAWLMLAQAAEQRGDYAAAERWLAQVDSPQRALEVQVRRATLMARQGKVAEARALVQAVPVSSPDDARAKLMAEAQMLRDVKEWSAAYEVLGRGAELFPDDIDVLYEQSMMAEKLGRLDDMERLLRRVIQLKPDHHHAYNALGYSLAERGQRLPEARALIQKALALAPGEPFITDSLGWVEYRMGNRAEALRLLRQAYAARPDTEIGAHLGEVLWADGQTDEARRVWREARQRDAANDVLRETLARLKVDL